MSEGDPITQACERAQRLVDNGAPCHQILTCLVGAAEAATGPDTVASILVLDNSGLLRNGASPSLPADYLSAIDRLKPDPNVGTCAAAAATGSIVITKDFRADSKWAELRHLPLALGFAGAWSMPIKSSNNKVLGTFGIYHRDIREPTGHELAAVGQLAEVAAKALEKMSSA